MHLYDLKPGLRLEIRKITDCIDCDESEKAKLKWHVSQLLDDYDGDHLLIAAPIERFRVVQWPVDSQVELTFTEPARGVWLVEGRIHEIGIHDQIAFFRIVPTGTARRIQRRSYFRLDCMLEINLHPDSEKDPPLSSYTKDISGGGLQLISDQPVEINVVYNMTLTINERQIKAKGQVVRCDEYGAGKEKYFDIALRFIRLRPADQDQLIQYIFECQKQRLAGQKE